MKTHYAKVDPKPGQKFETQIESVLYHIIPNDCLLTKNEIEDKLFVYIKNKPEEINKRLSFKEIDFCISNLCHKGYLKEIFGIKLEKFIKTVS